VSTFAQAYAADTIIKLLSYEKPFFFVGKQGEKSPEFCLFLQKKEGYFLTLDFTTENHKKQGFFTVIQYKKEIEKRMQKAERSRGRRLRRPAGRCGHRPLQILMIPTVCIVGAFLERPRNSQFLIIDRFRVLGVKIPNLSGGTFPDRLGLLLFSRCHYITLFPKNLPNIFPTL